MSFYRLNWPPLSYIHVLPPGPPESDLQMALLSLGITLSPGLLGVALALLLLLQLLLRRILLRKGVPLPPGPRGLPLIGNMLDMPRYKPWIGLRDFTATYGSLVYLRIPRNPLLIIGDADIAFELLDKKSAHTSDRPTNPMAELMGMDGIFGLMPYGERWKRHRRGFWPHFHPGVISKYHDAQSVQVRRFIAKLLHAPSRVKEHIRFNFSATMLKIGYDIEVQDERDEHIHVIDAALDAIGQAVPGRFLIEVLPWLRYVPAWVPGAGFQTVFARCKAANDRLKHQPFDELKQRLETDDPTIDPCLGIELLAQLKLDHEARHIPLEENDLAKNICANAFEGGAETTFSTLQAFFVAMVLHPEVQRKAQAELDAVVGSHRLPEHGDRPQLPYINALMKELLRWHVTLPIGVPHKTVRDTELGGYRVPAGTTVFVNVWHILHDPREYEDPDEFRPERFLEADGSPKTGIRDPTDLAFGFGRRVCPGRHFAEDILFLNITSVLHLLEIGPPVDQGGEPVQITYQQSHGLLSYPEDCRCSVKARSPDALALIME
ncbi:CyP450 monooxygenase [Cubamyces menziesii]|nr:CyP450 monooxygenase [Cubamyces menziesii]